VHAPARRSIFAMEADHPERMDDGYAATQNQHSAGAAAGDQPEECVDHQLALTWAVRTGRAEVVQALLLEAPAGAQTVTRHRDANGWAVLHWAAAGGHAEIAAGLCDLGADLLAPTADGRTAAHLAAAGDHRVTLELLLGLGASPDPLPAARGRVTPSHTPLQAAAAGGAAQVGTPQACFRALLLNLLCPGRQ
jgi:ankyrin repeat protein